MRSRRLLVLLALLPVWLLPLVGATGASAAGPVSQSLRFTTSDGVSLAATLTGQSPLTSRPTVVEFSPYGRNSQTLTVGPNYNFLLVQDRGTGDSDGQFDAMGRRMQQDVQETLRWACSQSWSNGALALNGFSASAILAYNAMHEPLPCVKAAIMKSGTSDLYRDLLVPGGISNIVPGAGVLALIGAPALEQGADRLQRNPSSSLDVMRGLFTSGLDAGLLHPTLDAWWRQRAFRGAAQPIPVLIIDGFFDVESRGAFQMYQALKGDGAHLMVVGGHDGAPAGTDDGVAEAGRWLDHYLRGVDNGVQADPRVQMFLSEGDRKAYLAGDFVRRDATDWPVPRTTWASLHLDPTKSGSAHSLNDGSLSLQPPSRIAVQSYPAVPSLPTSADVPNAAIVDAAGFDKVTDALPILSDMRLAESVGLTYTTAPFARAVDTVGPADLDVPLSSTTPGGPIWAVLSDVAPDGSTHPLTVGRLSTAFPKVDESKSLHDSSGRLVQPYGDYSVRESAGPLGVRTYHVEFWPIGNRFLAGHRLRLELVGASAASLPSLPGLNRVHVGGPDGAVLRLPVLPGSDLAAALR
ncbi:CocE/NonD family hydrolase [Nocardioides terrisoli]|uniref:CocE/NonD family hydrolase n=1 Tax=Nocardioides terrisoli TaxID=3388267 RepID=UPI00287BC2FC|nr:CocE/NonD family hydrolase [Nocardioides marmorisolisilvae]